jgi:hypothetical protein
VVAIFVSPDDIDHWQTYADSGSSGVQAGLANELHILEGMYAIESTRGNVHILGPRQADRDRRRLPPSNSPAAVVAAILSSWG